MFRYFKNLEENHGHHTPTSEDPDLGLVMPTDYIN